MPETRQKLLYASVLCFECFLISIFHLGAWSAKEKWFGESESFIDMDASEFHQEEYASLDG